MPTTPRHPLKTYYLSEKASKTASELGKLDGWRLHIASILLSDSMKEENQREEIRKLLDSAEPSERKTHEKIDDALSIVQLLPRTLHGRAKILLHHLLRLVRINDGIVELKDGTIVGTLVDILKFYCSPKNYNAPIPPGFETLNKMFVDHMVPQSAFAPEKNPYRIHKQRSWTSLFEKS